MINSSPDSIGAIEGFGILSLGNHIITLTVTDSDGLFIVLNEIITVGVPNEIPTCSLLSPSNGDAFPSSNTIEIQGEVSDVETIVTSLQVKFQSDIDGVLGTSTPDSNGQVYFLQPV